MITQRDKNGSYIIDFSDLEDWDAFDRIINILNEKFNVEIEDKLDGPESRIWRLRIDGFHLGLHNNPYGNYLKASSPESINYLKNALDKFKVVFY